MLKGLKGKKILYNQVLGNPAGAEVLSDLRVFCYATKSPFSDNELEMARRIGRQEVFMQIMNTMKIDFGEYYDYDPEDYFDGE